MNGADQQQQQQQCCRVPQQQLCDDGWESKASLVGDCGSSGGHAVECVTLSSPGALL